MTSGLPVVTLPGHLRPHATQAAHNNPDHGSDWADIIVPSR